MIEQKILSSFRGKSILITGATGMIGKQVVDILAGSGAILGTVSLDSVPSDWPAKHVTLDLRDYYNCKMIVSGIDYVIHLAGVKGSIEKTRKRPADLMVPILMLTVNMLEACREMSTEKVVWTSSIGAYSSECGDIFKEADSWKGQPLDFYPGWAKRMGELQIQAYREQYGLSNFSIVRPANVYGPFDDFGPDAMLVPALLSKIKRGDNPVVVWGDGSAVRDVVYSRDVAEGIILALYYGTDGEVLNLGSGRGYSVKEIVQTLQQFIPFNYVFDTTKPAGCPRRVLDISLAKKKLHYMPMTGLENGLRHTWLWLRNKEEKTHADNSDQTA